jgi:hypothetical protein
LTVPCNLLDRHFRIDTVLIEQIDHVDLQALQRSVRDLPDVLRATVQPGLSTLRIDPESELRRDRHAPTKRSQCLADEFLVGKRPIDFRGVEEGDAALDRRPDDRGHLLLIARRSVAKAHAHAAEPESRHFEAAVSEFAFSHDSCDSCCGAPPPTGAD